MTRKGVFPIVATLAVVGVVLAVFSQTVMRDSNISTNTMTTEQAYADLSGKMKRIGKSCLTGLTGSMLSLSPLVSNL